MRKLETSKSCEGEGVKGWLEGTEGEWAGNGNGNGNDEGTKEIDNGGGWDVGDNWGGTGGGNSQKANTTAKGNNNKNGKKNGTSDHAWGTDSSWNANDKPASNGGDHEWNDTSGVDNTGGGGGGNGW